MRIGDKIEAKYFHITLGDFPPGERPEAKVLWEPAEVVGFLVVVRRPGRADEAVPLDNVRPVEDAPT